MKLRFEKEGKVKIRRGFAVKKVGADEIATPIGKTAEEFRLVVKLNATAGFLWRYFETPHTEEEAAVALGRVYKVDKQQAQKDVASFVSFLKANRFSE